MVFSHVPRGVALVLALSLAPFAALPANAADPAGSPAPAAAAAAPAAPAAVAQDDSGSFTDVPAGHWAYQAVQELAADGYIQGFPNGTFGGDKPLTRYEMAVFTDRALSSIKAAIINGDQVSANDIAALRKLMTAFAADLKTVQANVTQLKGQEGALAAQLATAQQTSAKLSATQTALKSELDTTETGRRAAQLGFQSENRQASTFQEVSITNGPYARAGVLGTTSPPVLANGLFPAGYGAVPGQNRGANFSFGPGGPNSVYVGPGQNGAYSMVMKPWLYGTLGTHFTYFFRLAYTEQESPLGTNTATPIYCTSNVTAAYPCVYQDAKSNNAQIPVTLDSYYARWNSGHGLYAVLGKFTAATSTQDFSPEILAGNKMIGGQIGFRGDGFDGYIAAGNPNVTGEEFAQVQAISPVCTTGVLGLNAGPVQMTNLGINPYCNASSTNVYAHIGYHFDKTKTTIGYNEDAENNLLETYWDPGAGLCAATAPAAAAGTATAIAVNRSLCSGATPFALANASGAFIAAEGKIDNGNIFLVQEIGNRALHQMAVQLDVTKRFGNDPFTGQPWVGSNSYQAAFVYASRGNIDEGGPRGAVTSLSSGKANSDYYELLLNAVRMNSVAPSNGPYAAQTAPLYNVGLSNFSGTDIEMFLLGHWFTDYFRLGMGFIHYGTLPGIVIPAGGTTCPGCFAGRVNANSIYFNAFLNTVGGD